MEIILTSDFGLAGHLALSLGWLPQGSHFVTPAGKRARIVHPRDSWEFTLTRGDLLRVIPPLPQYAALAAQYVYDMGRCSIVIHD